MSQHDMVIDNNTGRAVRLDINDALAALVSNSSGSTEPDATFPYMFWVDTSGASGILKCRNAADSAWITIGDMSLDNLGTLLKTGGTMSGVLNILNAATVGTPDLCFSGDTDTGLYSPAANIFGLAAGAIELLRIDGVAGLVKLLGTKGTLLPNGTTAQRPSGTPTGLIRFNTDTAKFEGYSTAWKPVGGGGGGGAGFVWRGISGSAPLEQEEFGEVVSLFGAGQVPELYASIKVPSSYSAGDPITLLVSMYSPSGSNTALLLAQSTLIRKNTDAVSSTTNQRTTTNTALTNTLANMYQEVVLDITDTTGKINSVAVSPGDDIKVRLYRDTVTNSDTDTADIRVIKNATDVKYGT